MGEPITCPACGDPLAVADEHRGRAVRCPVCGHEFVAPPGAEFEELMAARPARRRRRRREWDEDEEDDIVAAARRKVAGPASWLRVIGGLHVLAAVVGLGATAWFGAEAADNPAAARQNLNAQDDEELAVLLVVLGLCSAGGGLVGGTLLYGAVRMARLESSGWATASAAMAVGLGLLCGCDLVLTLPFGVWALVVLNHPDVRDAFRILEARRRRGRDDW